jgi:hypothetical protein
MPGVEISKAESSASHVNACILAHHVEIPEMFRRDLATDLPVGHRHALRHGCDEIEVLLDQYDRQAATHVTPAGDVVPSRVQLVRPPPCALIVTAALCQTELATCAGRSEQ